MTDTMSFVYKTSDEVAPSLHNVLQDRGWTQWNTKHHKKNEWNLTWSTKRHTSSEMYSLHPFQKVNHFLKSSAITKKDSLLRNLRRMRNLFGKIYAFHPESWMFPRQYTEFVRETQKRKDMIWIAKPACGRRGQKIVIFKELNEFTFSEP